MRDKNEKFIQLAEARVARAIKDVRLIGNLSNRNAYSYSEEDVRKIFKTLLKELNSAKSRFGGDGAKRDEGFKLRD
jgi:hypothetical protein